MEQNIKKIKHYRLKCPNKGRKYNYDKVCNYEWNYTGKRKYGSEEDRFSRFVSCPMCRGSFSLKNYIVKIVYEGEEN